MKRLKNKLLTMDPHTSTYKEMYEGEMTVSDPENGSLELEYDPTYYDEDIGFRISYTHKLAQDRPTVTVSIPCAAHGIPLPSEKTACAEADFFLRAFNKYINELNEELYNRSRPDNENGKYYLPDPGGEMLARNAAFFALCPQKDYENGPGSRVYIIQSQVERPPVVNLCFTLQVQLPQRKMRKTIQMLCKDLPGAVKRLVMNFDSERLAETIALAKKQTQIRTWLKSSNYCAFIANGSILPRAKDGDLPLENAVPFISAQEDEIEICGLKGMGFPKGVTVITGGGYSGKSTLLDALSAGIYDHVLGDGRELCITDQSAVTIAAEDGRSIKRVNISPFVKWLPSGNTCDFSTEHASGATSQAANIVEAVDFGAKLLLIDEDKSATNFMIRDRMMKELIQKEPITPFTDRVNELHVTHGVSTILVIGGSGEYLSVADNIYMMEDYRIRNVTEKSRGICSVYGVTAQSPAAANWNQERILCSDFFTSFPDEIGREKLEISDMGFVLIGDEQIDIRGLYNIVSSRQINALGFMLRFLEISNNDQRINLEEKINGLYTQIEEEGLDFLYSPFFTTCERFLDLPRKEELMALINRMRRINYVWNAV